MKPSLQNNPGTANANVISQAGTRLLDGIRAIRASVGDALNDDEFTRLLEHAPLPTEEGFAFLSYSDRFVMLSVPQQDLQKWYPGEVWIAAEKEKIARAIAEKYELSLCEPPDLAPSCRFPIPSSTHFHHHLELSNRRETIIVAHPHYLKIRLYGGTLTGLHAAVPQSPLLLDPKLLPDFSALYQS
ncbi:MAG TPA: hypothetical protein VNH84_10910 [Candidatus Saccharimonadales bacterium]|nr:hypothetical protein [Candidatus Saccharimonadales bacterium]